MASSVSLLEVELVPTPHETAADEMHERLVFVIVGLPDPKSPGRCKRLASVETLWIASPHFIHLGPDALLRKSRRGDGDSSRNGKNNGAHDISP